MKEGNLHPAFISTCYPLATFLISLTTSLGYLLVKKVLHPSFSFSAPLAVWCELSKETFAVAK